MTYTIASIEILPKTEPKTILSIPAALPVPAPSAAATVAVPQSPVSHETPQSPAAVRTPPKPIATTTPRRSPPSASASASVLSSSQSLSPYSQSYPYNSSPIRHSPLSQPPLYAPSRTPSPSSGPGGYRSDLIHQDENETQDVGGDFGVTGRRYESPDPAPLSHSHTIPDAQVSMPRP
ncbi:hypothetical protein IAU59_003554 [Kwoniella sp. CBS 9459]